MPSAAPEGFLQPYLGLYLPWLYHESILWTAFGFIATATFSGRFVIQWLHSEKVKKVVVPSVFWHLSFWGSLFQLIYLIHVDKAALIVGYCFLPFLYARNLYLIYFPHPGEEPPEEDDAVPVSTSSPQK